MHHEYSGASAGVNGSYINDIKSRMKREGMSFIQQYSMRKGLKTFGRETGMKSMTKEIEQLHQRNSLKPINLSSMTDGEKARVQNAIMLLAQKDSEDEVSKIETGVQWKRNSEVAFSGTNKSIFFRFLRVSRLQT